MSPHKPYRILISSKGQAAGLGVAIAFAGWMQGDIPPLYAFAGIFAVLIAYIGATALEDKGPKTEVSVGTKEEKPDDTR